MRRIRSADTSPELAVRRALHRLGYRYRVHVRDLPGKPDLVFPGRRCVIMVHGCFWHGHKGCRESKLPSSNQDYWVAKRARNQDRDRANIRALRRGGWRVLVVWECKTEDMGKLLPQLVRFLK